MELIRERAAGDLARAQTNCSLAAACLMCALFAIPVRTAGAPLDPNAYTSLGTLNVASGTLTFNTDTLAVSGAFSGAGVIQSQGAGLPDVAVFDFSSINIAAGVTLNFTGSRPIALLSRGNATIDAAINIAGSNGPSNVASGTAAGAGGVGGSRGGQTGQATGSPGSGGQPGQGPGAGWGGSPQGGAGAGGGFGGAGGRAMGGGAAGGVGGGGIAYGDLAAGLQGGSGGGGGAYTGSGTAGAGGGSGGAIEIGAIGALSLGGANAIVGQGGNGGFSAAAGGGGGSGGGIILHAATVAITGPINASGGAGGAGQANQFSTPADGGGGGGGRVLLLPGSYTLGAASWTVNVNGGLAPARQINGQNSHNGAYGEAGVANLRPKMTILPAGQVRQLGADGTFSEGAPGGWNLATDGLQVNAGALLFSTQPVNSSHDLALSGGQVASPAGWNMTAAAQISGYGTLSGALTGGAGNTINASGGVLSLGDVNSTSGFDFGGAIEIASGATLQLQDANGATLQPGGSMTATGNATVDGKFSNQGAVHGPTAGGQFLTFADDVSGVGTYSGNVLFSDGFSPGNSPASVALENVAFDATARLEIDLGGLTPGIEHDQLEVSGTATLDGTLAVLLAPGFSPALGDRFTILTYANHSGTFATYSGLDLGGPLALKPIVGATSLALLVGPSLDGDVSLDGVVNLVDVQVVGQNWQTAGPAGDANGEGFVNLVDVQYIGQRWGNSSGNGQAVPEPSTWALALLGAAALVAGRGRLRLLVV